MTAEIWVLKNLVSQLNNKIEKLSTDDRSYKARYYTDDTKKGTISVQFNSFCLHTKKCRLFSKLVLFYYYTFEYWRPICKAKNEGVFLHSFGTKVSPS